MKKMLMAGRKSNRKSGFTLVEIIAVLVILAILTAVAVPKYFDLADTAKRKAIQGAVAEGMSVCSLAYSKEALDTGGEPAVADVQTEASGVNIEGDFTYTFSVVGGNIQIAVSGLGISTNAIWTMP